MIGARTSNGWTAAIAALATFTVLVWSGVGLRYATRRSGAEKRVAVALPPEAGGDDFGGTRFARSDASSRPDARENASLAARDESHRKNALTR